MRNFAIFVVAVILLISCGDEKINISFKAAAGLIEITPSENVTMGGYFGREGLSEGVHDDLYARCLILESSDGKRMALVSLDLIGFLRYDVLEIRKELDDNIELCIFSTHQHSGPDTIGIWGTPSKSGRNENYMAEVRKKIVDLVQSTSKKLETASIYIAQTSGKGLSVNYRVADEIDETITTLLIKGKNGNIATLVNFGCHPEALNSKNKLITADFPGHLVKKLEKELGGTALFANGLLGAMVSIDRKTLNLKEKNFETAEKVGDEIAQRVILSLPSAKLIIGNLTIDKKIVSVHLENPLLQASIKSKIIPTSEKTFEKDCVLTEVGIISLGKMKIMLVPGEMTPGLGIKIKELLNADYKITFGLANDEIGYIIPSENFSLPLYEKERIKSLGPSTGNLIYQTFKELAAQ